MLENTDDKNKFSLQEVKVAAEITAKGGLALFGVVDAEFRVKGGITFTFKR